MKEIILTRGMVALVDDTDFEVQNQHKWYAMKCRGVYYAVRNAPRKNGRQKMILLHREIMNTPDNMEVDHQDHNGLNCQRFNMKNGTHRQNRMNAKPYGVSQYLGVSFRPEANKTKFRARIRIDGRYVSLGCFENEEHAAIAYDRAAKEHHKEFANLNFK